MAQAKLGPDVHGRVARNVDERIREEDLEAWTRAAEAKKGVRQT